MNLKQAAKQLEVHYQTAYRWVRDGELVAVKIGNRYEVSESAIEQFVNRRASLTTVSNGLPDPAAPTQPRTNDELAELRELVRNTRLTAQPCFDAATMIAGTQAGGAAVLRLLDESGQKLRPVASFAADPQDRALVAGAVAAAGSFARSNPLWSGAEQSGEVHVVHHMPRDVIRELFGAEGRFAGHGVQVLAAAIAPMFDHGAFLGGLLAVKTQSHLPFSEAEVDLMGEMAVLCSQAHRTAAVFGNTWRSNTELTSRAATWVAETAASDLEPTTADQLLDTERPQALVSPLGVVFVSTEKYITLTGRMGTRPEAFAGHWEMDQVRDTIDGVSAQVETDPVNSRDAGAIVSGVRRPDAELRLLAVDVLSY